ncbi:hypothetical protein [Halobellus inordinatus]|uniref:hypothetical protein n=1 Tax=Halobellus inordinatus TaxID=1126236 RepID=UPI00210A1773|nr:hypothetical protein [Halobellus inordinatus]
MTGEVAVRENGGVTAIEADSLDGNVSVDLDHDPPMVGVPEETAVVYEADELEATDATDEDVATDGGFVRDRVTMRQYGLGLSSGNRNIILTVMAFAYAAAGYLVGVGEGTAAIVTFAAAAAVTFFLQYRRPDRD